jgi:MFS family permease
MATRTYQTVAGQEIRVPTRAGPARSTLVRWSAVFAGGVLAIGLAELGTMLWHALAFSSGYPHFVDNLAWWDAGTSILVLFLGGLLAGWLSSRHSWTVALLHGVIVWAILVAGTVVFGVGSALPLLTLSDAGRAVAEARPGSLWPTFVAFAIGLASAGVGGIVGGLLPRPAASPDDVDVEVREPGDVVGRGAP